eukprot:m.361867 g.361867  ORF g.361867 m.361867 type:complete len:352 (-) comp19946_c0_seq1:366-1421(-)
MRLAKPGNVSRALGVWLLLHCCLVTGVDGAEAAASAPDWCASKAACPPRASQLPTALKPLAVGPLLAEHDVVWVRSSEQVKPPAKPSVPFGVLPARKSKRVQKHAAPVAFFAYSETFKVVLIRNLKAGSSSCYYNMAEALWDVSGWRTASATQRAKLTEEQTRRFSLPVYQSLDLDKFADYLIVSTVRDPYDRAISGHAMAQRRHEEQASSGQYTQVPPLLEFLASPDYPRAIFNTSNLPVNHVGTQTQKLLMRDQFSWLPNVLSRVSSINNLFAIIHDWIQERLRTDKEYRSRMTPDDLAALKRFSELAAAGLEVRNHHSHPISVPPKLKADVCTGYLQIDYALLCLSPK